MEIYYIYFYNYIFFLYLLYSHCLHKYIIIIDAIISTIKIPFYQLLGRFNININITYMYVHDKY